jgi:hypothetical protein
MHYKPRVLIESKDLTTLAGTKGRFYESPYHLSSVLVIE